MKNQEKFAKALGEYLRAKRLDAGFTLEELAEKTDLDDKHISKIERGIKTPSSYTLFKLLQILDANEVTLFQKVSRQMKMM